MDALMVPPSRILQWASPKLRQPQTIGVLKSKDFLQISQIRARIDEGGTSGRALRSGQGPTRVIGTQVTG